MPAVNNVHVYNAHGAQKLVLFDGSGVRTLGGTYVDIQGKVKDGQQIIVGNSYLVSEGPRSGTNQGRELTCTLITVDGATYQ